MPFRIPAMWSFFVIASITTVMCQQQNSRRPEPYDNGHGWDIRLAVPGEPGGDYPTLNAIPRTTFSCSRKSPGYYADVETGCQVFRVCTLGSTYGFQSFLCPNGTLFNQEVFVCDWWMNVKCDRSQQLFSDNREKFGNLKLGPQLMKDIKKMLTHPMRNPYDKSIMKSNLIVMQEYKPPSGQLFPNGALISGPERPPSNIYIPAKIRQGNFAQNSFISGDLSYAASTPSSQYIPPSYNLFGTSKDIDVTQQRLSIQNSNSHSGMIRASNSEFTNNNRLSQSSLPHDQNQNQKNFQLTSQKNPNSQIQRQTTEYNPNLNSQNQIKRPGLSPNNMQQQFTYNSNQQFVQKNNIPQLNVAKQNLAGPNGIQPTGKTFKFSRIVQKSASGNPKSRITFKTWIVRPSKSARLAVEPTPYTYDKPTDAPLENRLVDTTIYDKSSTTENPDSENIAYVYNKPTPSSKQIVAVEETPFIYLPPTAPTLSNQLLSTSTKPQAFKQSNLDLPPTTYKPASRIYVPPSESSLGLSRQYLGPEVESPEANNFESARLVVTPTPAVSNNEKSPSFSLIKQSYINTNHNNLTFADILTKEKLDITVNDIVKNTNEILKNATPDELNRYRQNTENENNLPNNQLSLDFNNNEEILTLQSSQTDGKNEKLIATPSTELEPPEVTPKENYQNSNRLLNLPFFKEPPVPTNTIERTVSLKITIPETIANYIFKNHSENNSDNLEILNTGSSNYLVFANNNLDENSGLVPIGKLVWDKNINVSNSQAFNFVFSFLADSLNAVKEYSNIAKQNLVPTTTTQLPTTNINNEDIGEITNKVARLTSSQFSNNNANNFVSSSNSEQYRGNNRQVTELTQRYALNHQPKSQYVEQNELDPIYSSRLQRLSNNNLIDTQKNTEQIYSGQLYQLTVPEVTCKIYNVPNLVQTSKIRQTSELARNSQLNLNIPENNNNKRPNSDVEVLQSEPSLYPLLRQELPRIGESIKFNNLQSNYENIFAENHLNTDTAITAQVEDKIKGSLPHPLEENKLVTYEKNKSYYLYTKIDDDNNNNVASNSIPQINERSNIHNEKLIRSNNDLGNRLTYELFPAIGYELAGERKKQPLYNNFNINDFSNQDNTGRSESINRRQDNLVTGVDFTILHPSSKKQVEQRNNANTILYRGPSSYLAPQSSVGSLGQIQQIKSNGRIEQFEDNNGYSKTVPARQFSF